MPFYAEAIDGNLNIIENPSLPPTKFKYKKKSRYVFDGCI